MEVRRGFGIAGSRTSGPVTVGDPLTLLIHMKSEKGSFFFIHIDIFVFAIFFEIILIFN